MLFTGSLTIPANTLSTSPTRATVPIARGIITKYMVRPRPGHAGLAHLVIKFHNTQIAPSNPSYDLHGDSFPIDWEDYYETYQPPFEIELVGWNDDDTFPHTFDVFVAILPRKAVLALAVADAFMSFIGRLSPTRIFTAGGA